MWTAGEFKYRKYWKRVVVSIFLILIINSLKNLLLSKIINNNQYIIVSLSLTMLFMFFYYKMTRRYFLCTGKYSFNDNSIELYMNGKLIIVKLDKIKEISYMRRSVFGEQYILLTIEQYGEKTIKIISENIEYDYDISVYSLYKIYRFVEYNSEDLKSANYNNSDCFVLVR